MNSTKWKFSISLSSKDFIPNRQIYYKVHRLRNNVFQTLVVSIGFIGYLSACSGDHIAHQQTPVYTSPVSNTPTLVIPTNSSSENTSITKTQELPTPSPTKKPSYTPTKTIKPAAHTPTSTQTITPSPTITPTYAIVRGKVLPEKANCRYGPGAPYLYKYGLVGGSNLEIIGRNDQGSWLLIQAIGGSNPCWVKADLMEINGDKMSVEPLSPEIIQAWSPYYPPVTNVSSLRDENMVNIFWSPLVLRAGDDSEQVPYIVEAWVCQDGKFIFVPVGSYSTAAQIKDEPDCPEISHGQVIAAEKHGYTLPVEVPWPQPGQ